MCKADGRRPLDLSTHSHKKGIVFLCFLFLSTLNIVPPIEAFDHGPKDYRINHDGNQHEPEVNRHAHGNTGNDHEKRAKSYKVPTQKVDFRDKLHACRPNRTGTSRCIIDILVQLFAHVRRSRQGKRNDLTQSNQYPIRGQVVQEGTGK